MISKERDVATSPFPGAGPRASQFVRGDVVSRGVRAGVRSGAILGGALGTALWPIGGTVFGALLGAAVGAGFGLMTGAVLSVVNVGEGDRSRVRWAAAFTSGTGAALAADALHLSGALSAVLIVVSGLVAAIDAPRVAFGPRAPWSPRRQASRGPAALSDALDWAAGGVAAGVGTGLVVGAVFALAGHDGAVATIRTVLNAAVGGILPGLLAGGVVGGCIVLARRWRIWSA